MCLYAVGVFRQTPFGAYRNSGPVASDQCPDQHVYTRQMLTILLLQVKKPQMPVLLLRMPPHRERRQLGPKGSRKLCQRMKVQSIHRRYDDIRGEDQCTQCKHIGVRQAIRDACERHCCSSRAVVLNIEGRYPEK